MVIQAMPRIRPNVLERDALADLWKHTLSGIPTLCGRLAYLSSLRDPYSGAYRHHGLSAAFGREESAKALRKSHEEAFLKWLSLTMMEKATDLRVYLAGLEDSGDQVIGYWLRSGHLRNLLPESSRRSERELFERDMEALLEVFRNDPELLRRIPGLTQSE